MNEHDVRTAFERALGDEPPLATRIEPVVAAGRRIRHRRYAYGAAGVAASVAIAVTGVAVATRGPSADHLLPVPVRPAAGSTATRPAPDLSGLTAFQRTVATAILDATPDGWTVDVSRPRWDAPNDIRTTVDDGAGASALDIGVMVGAGWNQLLHPCREAEFASGASCVETTLPDGAVLSVRGVAPVPASGAEGKGLNAVTVVLSRPDGSGINAASTNYTVAATIPGHRYTAEEKANLYTRTRPLPAYTAEQLAALVRGIDEATRG